MQKENPIGLFDSGMGGLTIASEVVKLLPGENIIYYGDNLHIPYGSKTPEEVKGYVLAIVDYLVNLQKAKFIVIACNTATVAGIEAVRQKYTIPVLDPVSQASKKAIRTSKNQKIGLIATIGTVESKGYQKLLHQLNPQAEVVAVPTPKLVPFVESGHFDGPEVEQALREYLDPIMQVGCDSLILGCTHYPFLTETIKKVSDNKLQIIFPGTEIAQELQKYLNEHDLLNPGTQGQEICETSALKNVSEDFLRIGRKTLGMKLDFKENNIFE